MILYSCYFMIYYNNKSFLLGHYFVPSFVSSASSAIISLKPSSPNGAPYSNTLDTTPSPFVRPSLKRIVVPIFKYSGLYMNRNLMNPLS